MFKSIRTSIILLFTIILVFTNILIIVYALDQSHSMIEDEASKGLSGMLTETNKLIQSRVSAEMVFLSEIASNPIIDDDTLWIDKVSYLREKAYSRGYTIFAFIEMDGVITRFDIEKSKGNATGRTYFAQAQNGEPAISDIIISSVTGEPIIVIAVPIIRNGKIIGVLNGVRPQTGLNKIIKDFKYGNTGSAFIINKEGMIMAHTNLPYVLDSVNFIELLSNNKTFDTTKFSDMIKSEKPEIDIFTDYTGKEKIFATSAIDGTNWILVATVETDDIFSNVEILKNTLYSALILIVILGAGITYIAISRLIAPLNKITDQVKSTSEGNLNTPINPKLIASKNEIGTLASAFEYMRIQLDASFNDIQLDNEKLEQMVKLRTKELVETQKQLTMVSLIKWLAHHMNTPLGNIISLQSFLRHTSKKDFCEKPDTVNEVLDMIENNTNKLVSTMNSLKRISEMDNVSHEESIVLHEFILENTYFLMNENIKLDLDLERDIIINTKPSVVFQVLSILIENVLTHAYDEAISEKYLGIQCYQEDNYVYIKVIDNGKGLDEEYKNHVFKPFYEKLNGKSASGLGLQIAYHQTVSLLLGELFLEPSDIGACFVIKLPYKTYI